MQKALEGRGWHKDQSGIPWQECKCGILREMGMGRTCGKGKRHHDGKTISVWGLDGKAVREDWSLSHRVSD